MLLACLLLCFGRLSKMYKQFFRKKIAINSNKNTAKGMGKGDAGEWLGWMAGVYMNWGILYEISV